MLHSSHVTALRQKYKTKKKKLSANPNLLGNENSLGAAATGDNHSLSFRRHYSVSRVNVIIFGFPFMFSSGQGIGYVITAILQALQGTIGSDVAL